MNKGIVISSSEYSKPFLMDLLATLKTDYPIYICWEGLGRPEGSFEIGAIRKGMELFDEFIYLHDTVEIKDNSLFEKLFDTEGHVLLTKGCYHYFGKYVSKDMPALPSVTNKQEAIHQEIRWFTKPHSIFEQELPHTTSTREDKHGRINMVCENDYIKKYKATFHI